MRIALRHRSLIVLPYRDESDLQEAASQCRLGELVIGRGSEPVAQRYLIRVTPEMHAGDEFAIVLNAEDHGLAPEIFLDSSTELLWIGFNSELAVVSMESREIAASHKFESVFYDLVPIPQSNRVLVIYETGIAAFDQDASPKWSKATGIIQSVRFTNRSVFVQQMEERPIKLSLETGRVTPVQA